MAEEAVSATIEVLVQNLIYVSKDEISLIRGLEDDADKLKETLGTIQTSLDDAQEKFITDVQVKRWLQKLEAAAFDADNVLDELNYQRLKSIHSKKKKAPSCFLSFDRCLLRRDMAVKIRKLNTNFESIDKWASELGLERRLAAAPAATASDAALETDAYTVDPIFFGRNDQLSDIVKTLTTPTEEPVSVLPIVGMGGLGKTTLARKVFHHEDTKAHFGQRIWVHVSPHFDAMSLLKKILANLRSLNISYTNIRNLPESIGELYHLQTFRACRVLEKLPSTLTYLCNLRHLHVYKDTKLPPQLGMLTSLQTLPYFKVGDEEGHRIVELGSLKHFKGELKIHNLENVQGEEESTKAHLSRKSGIVKLVLEWDGSREGEINNENVLKGLQPHPNVKTLKISEYGGARFPSWTLKMAVCVEGRWVQLHNLVEIRLEYCYKCEEIPTMGHLPRLESLYLSRLKNVKSIGSSFYVIDDCSSNRHGVCKETVCVFPALERLELRDMPNLMEWKGVEIPSAAEVKVFSRLKYLEIRRCEKLASICGTLDCLEELRIEKCSNLKWVQYSSSGRQSQGFTLEPAASLPNLQTLTIIYSNAGDSDSGDSVSSSLNGILRLVSHSLRKLSLTGNDDCESLPDQIQHLTALSDLELSNFGIEELPEWFGYLSSLQELKLSLCRKLKHLPSVEAMRRLTKLTLLDIHGCPLLEGRAIEQPSDDDDDSEWPKISRIPTIQLDMWVIEMGVRRPRGPVDGNYYYPMPPQMFSDENPEACCIQ